MFPRPPLALALSGLDPDPSTPWAAGPRAAIQWASTLGYRAVQLDATAPGIRARELDRSGRRDLGALLRRSQLTLSGLDLWIPPEHVTDPARADRALAAIQGATELATDLTRLVDGSPPPTISVVLPLPLPADAAAAIGGFAQRSGARLANHALVVQGPQGGTAATAPPEDALIGIGIDPAALLLAGQDPAASAARAARSLVSARLSDATLTGRTAPGAGRLDEMAYAASLAVAGYARPIVLDLRELRSQDAVARDVISRW